jgi:exopolyphosphatase/guanosine-5'-triphosphate,3'-diphosphate pyrophosphatase
MKIAIIDLGTNTFNLLIGEIKDDKLSFLHKDRKIVKLAEGSDNLDYIREVPYQRAISAIRDYAHIIEDFEVDQIVANATSGLRSAGNADQFTLDCWMNYKIQIQVIDGIREAELIYKGVKQAVMLHEEVSLIMDIGGGSTEFNLVTQNELLWSKSYPLGASRLKENFQPNDVLSSEDIYEFNMHFENTLTELIEAINKYNPIEIIGSSGAFDTLVDMILMKNKNHRLKEITYQFKWEDYKEISHKMYSLPLIERKSIPGMIDLRAELMPISCLLMDYIFDKTRVTKFRMSQYSLKEGLFYEMAQELK